MKAKKEIICYGVYRTRTSQQEWYETSSRDAGRRARQLRKLGFQVFVSGMGPQVTGVGRVNMTLLTVNYPGDADIPKPDRVERF